jgi:UDP-N-acetylglucosamine 2-epimerase
MKLATIVGARPQFIKAAPVSKALRQDHHLEILVHTGQHYDDGMSAVFFEELDLPVPDYNLGAGSGPQGAQTGVMLTRIEEVLSNEKPDWVLVYGDTNSTIAGALAAAKLRCRVAHIEAGLRSFNRDMPEEINRVLTDHIANLLLCPSQTAVDNLAAEGINAGVHLVGDVMADVLEQTIERARISSNVLERFALTPQRYLLATIHRQENTDDLARLHDILLAFNQVDETIVFPIHPRTRRAIARLNGSVSLTSRLRVIDPLGYLDLMRLAQSARLVLTDSGGLQKEAYWLGVPCVTLRDQTEWVETVGAGWNILTGARTDAIVQAVSSFQPAAARPTLYGNGKSAVEITRILAMTSSCHRPPLL